MDYTELASLEEHSSLVFENTLADSGSASQVRNDEMNLAWQFISETNVSVFLTGKAGTGKTTFLRKLRERLPKRMVVLAPTGVAAINAQGQTIHSFFQLPFGPIIPEKDAERKSYYKMGKDKKNIIRTLDLLVIDEISMVRADLLDAIDVELRKYKDRTKPFGGVQLLLIGDLQQLAPVAKESEWQLLKPYYDTQYFFGSRALQQINYVTIELQHIYRQSDTTFIELLAKIRNNKVDEATINALNSRYVEGFNPPDGEDWIRLTTHNNMAQQYNEQKLEALPAYPMKFKAKVFKNFPEANFPADETLILKTGAQVMFIKNDPSGAHEYYNGKIGVVRGMGENDNVIVWCKEDNRNISVGPVNWENTKYTIDPESKEIKEEVEGVFTQYPLRLAWAITVHKSQGLTFDHAVLDINQSFAHGQTYVALSRCRTLEGMVLSRKMDARSVITDSSVNKYMDKELEEARSVSQRLPQMKFDYYLSLLDELFSFSTLQQDFNYFTRVVDEHLYKQYPEFLNLLKERKDTVTTALVNVSGTFRNQYLQIMRDEGHKSAHLKERLNASAGYFSEKLREIFDPVMKDWNLKIGNKQTVSQYGNALDALKLSLSVKMGVFKYIGEEGFSVKNYLSAKAKSTLDDLKPDKKVTVLKEGESPLVKEKKVKRQKGDSEKETLAMFKDGKSVSEIAATRSLTQSTIIGHLSSFVSTGDVKLDDLVSPERQAKIKAVYDSIGDEEEHKLSAVKALLPEDYNYGEIKLVIEHRK